MYKLDLKNASVASASPAQEADPLRERRSDVVEVLIPAEPGRAARQRGAER